MPDTNPAKNSPDPTELLAQVRSAVSVKRVFGEPVEHNGLVVIPAARIRGGGGGGGGSEDSGESGSRGGSGSGVGFGVAGQPAGAFVIRGDSVSWEPAVDRQRVVLASLGLAAVALVCIRSIVRLRFRG